MQVTLGYVVYHETFSEVFETHFLDCAMEAVELKQELEEEGWNDVRTHTVEVEV